MRRRHIRPPHRKGPSHGPLVGIKTKGMGVERQTKVGTHDPLGGPKTEGMGVSRQTKVGTHDPSGHGAEAARRLYAVQHPDTALRITTVN
jgi:hypothetical protein